MSIVYKVVLASLVDAIDYPTAADFFTVFDGGEIISMTGGSTPYVSNVGVHFDGHRNEMGNVYPVYVTEAGYYKMDAKITGTQYITTTTIVGGVSRGVTWVGTGTTESKFASNDAETDDHFGESVFISGDYAIVGAWFEDTGGSNAGAAYIFKRTGASWAQEAKVVADDAAAGDNFGYSVSISGDYAIIGAHVESTGGNYSGAAYIFKRTGTSWAQQTKAVASDAEASDNFGYSVAISGDYAIVGAYGESTGGGYSGAAYIFKLTGTSWAQEAKVFASDADVNDQFGTAIAISGDYAIVGAYNESTGGSGAGAAYIFKRTGTSWAQETKVVANDPAANDNFGDVVAISGDYAIVGSYLEDAGGSNAGAAYIFKRTGTSWAQEAKVVASDAAANDLFGSSLAISGDHVIIGAYGEDAAGNYSGAAYIFKRTGTSWAQQTKVVASDAAANDHFGNAVGISGNYAIIGARLEGPSGSSTGAAYIYTTVETSLPQLTHDGSGKLTMNNTSNATTATNLRFGSNVWDLGTLGTVHICKPGDYKSFTVDSEGEKAYFGNVTVAAGTTIDAPVPPSVSGTLSFHHGNFANEYSAVNIAAAAANGQVFADTSIDTYPWGTLSSVTLTSTTTTYVWTPPAVMTANVLMVAAGGGGGGTIAGGGGAGGLLYHADQTLSGQKTIVVGVGGEGGVGWNYPSAEGKPGEDTAFTGLTTAVGGGGGANYQDSGGVVLANKNGGSGGGGSEGGGSAGTGVSGQGYNGGVYNVRAGSGGGGAGGVGQNASSTSVAGDGGLGVDYTSTFTATYGDSGYFASGGGGGNDGATEGHASQGGGSDGGLDSNPTLADGQKHTGGGGGGAGYYTGTSSQIGANGGSGIVLMNYTYTGSSASLTFDNYNKLVVVGDAVKTLYQGSNIYNLGTASNVYIADPGEYTYFTTTSDFAFLSNVTVGEVTTGSRPSITYDGINNLNITGAEADANITWVNYDTGAKYGSGVNKTTYDLYTNGNFKALVSGANTFVITSNTLVPVDDILPMYKYPPLSGTLTTGATTATANDPSYFTVSGAPYGNGEYITYANVQGLAGNDSFRAFTNTFDYGFRSSNSSGILEIRFPTGVQPVIRKYVVWSGIDGVNSDLRPSSWTLQGSQDSSTWTTLHTVTTMPALPSRALVVTSPNPYNRYRLNVADNNDGSGLIITELQLYGDIPFDITFSDGWALGSEANTITVGDSFTLPTYSTDVTGASVSSSINTDTAGNYNFIYSYPDITGVKKRIVRTLIVEYPILSFHDGNFDATDYSSASSTVEVAGAKGFIYADTPASTYPWGILGTTTTSSTNTTYTWTPPASVQGDILMVAGGGGGPDTSGGSSGGAGAGGLVFIAKDGVLSGAKTLVVGGGGLTGLTGDGGDGGDTTFTGLTDVIGGGGGTFVNQVGRVGGSGSGATHFYPTSVGAGTAGQGNYGGNGGNNSYRTGGGGGGAGGPGINSSTGSLAGGIGGVGLDYTSTFTAVYGDSGYFAGGGGGTNLAAGGNGGGGNGSTNAGTADGGSGQKHTGGGGGASGGSGGSGGSGIILIKLATVPVVVYEPEIFDVTYHKFMAAGPSGNAAMLPHELFVYLIKNDATATLMHTFDVLDSDWTTETFQFVKLNSTDTYRLGFIIEQDETSFSDVGFDDISFTVNGSGTTIIPTDSYINRWDRTVNNNTKDTAHLLDVFSNGHNITYGTEFGDINYNDGNLSTGLTPLTGRFIYFEGSYENLGALYITTSPFGVVVDPDAEVIVVTYHKFMAAGPSSNPDMLPHELFVYLITNDVTATLMHTFDVLDSDWTTETFQFTRTNSTDTYKLGFIIEQDDSSFSDVGFDDMSFTVNGSGTSTSIPTESSDNKWDRTTSNNSKDTAHLLDVISNGQTITYSVFDARINYHNGNLSTGLTPLTGTFMYFEGSNTNIGAMYMTTSTFGGT
jgi:hypothetical protein